MQEAELLSQLAVPSSEESDDDSPKAEKHKCQTPSHKRVKYVGTTVTIPPDIMSRPAVVCAATRMNISPSQQAAITEVIIKESGGDLNSVKTAYAVAARARRSITEEISQDVKKNWEAPSAASLHWDGKQIVELTDNDKKVERLPILVGNSDNVQLLGVEKYHSKSDKKSGETILRKIHDLLQE